MMEDIIGTFRMIKVIRRGHKKKSAYCRLLKNPDMFPLLEGGGGAIINSKTGEYYGII